MGIKHLQSNQLLGMAPMLLLATSTSPRLLSFSTVLVLAPFG
jgi:hypothetical protein